MNDTRQLPRVRFPLMALGVLALLAALWAGLLRMGWQFPPIVEGIAALHGPLIVAGFLGTLISIERAAALGQRWTYLAPLCSGIGALVLLTANAIARTSNAPLLGLQAVALGAAPTLGILLFVASGVFLTAANVVIVRRQPARFTYTMALGALAFLIGNLLWLAGLPLSRVVWWWGAFLVLTIVGERLELSRIQQLSVWSLRLYIAALALYVGGLVVATAETLALPETALFVGDQLMGVGMIALALWLLRYDLARRTVRQQGLTRYIAWCLLTGYVWLAVSGLLVIAYPGAGGGFLYDSQLHTLFVGFVISMIFGHAPIILPGVIGRPVAYTPLFYAPLVLLHLSLILRIVGDLMLDSTLRQWGGLLNAAAILLFLVLVARGVIMGQAQTHTAAAQT